MKIVLWEQWERTFHHPVYPMGSYFDKSLQCRNLDEARGVAQGLMRDPANRNVRVSDTGVAP